MVHDLSPRLPDLDVGDPEDEAAAGRHGTKDGKVVRAVLLRQGDDAEADRLRVIETLEDVGLDASATLTAYELPAKDGAVTTIPLGSGPLGLVLLVGCGDGSPSAVRLAGAAAARAAKRPTVLLVDVPGGLASDALVEGVVLGDYTPPKWIAGGLDHGKGIGRLALRGAVDGEAARRGLTRARASLLSRNLANAPSNVKNPAWVADYAVRASEAAGLDVVVLDEAQLATGGFGGLLAVGAGSRTPPRLVQLTYTPEQEPEDARPLVIVGKGITFDTGGLNVKPAAGMLTMKTDMSGSAIVLAVLAACRELGVRRRVVGLLALAENAVGGGAYRPSDVLTQYGGTTVEVGNTDAEGRLVLADALAYAVDRLDPAALIDIATLTGHARIALADAMAPSYGTESTLHAAVREAFGAAGEPLWEMPLVDDYRASLDSHVADISHIGPLGGANAGSILAALFLREFVGEVPWVHLDIAGTGRSELDAGLVAVGATGYGARGLLRWLEGSR